MRLQQHQPRDHAEDDDEGQHAVGKGLHALLVDGNDVREQHDDRELRHLRGLQIAADGQEYPPLRAVQLRHEEHDDEQYDRDGHDGPRKFVEDVVIHVGRDEHHDHAHRGEQRLLADEVEAVALEAVIRRGIAGAEQHHQPEHHQRQHDDGQRPVQRRLAEQPDAGLGLAF